MAPRENEMNECWGRMWNANVVGWEMGEGGGKKARDDGNGHWLPVV